MCVIERTWGNKARQRGGFLCPTSQCSTSLHHFANLWPNRLGVFRQCLGATAWSASRQCPNMSQTDLAVLCVGMTQMAFLNSHPSCYNLLLSAAWPLKFPSSPVICDPASSFALLASVQPATAKVILPACLSDPFVCFSLFLLLPRCIKHKCLIFPWKCLCAARCLG